LPAWIENDPLIYEEEKRWSDAASVLRGITPEMVKKAGCKISYSRISKLVRYKEWISGHMVARIVKAFPDIRVRLVEGAIKYHDCHGMLGIEVSAKNYIENMRGWRRQSVPAQTTQDLFQNCHDELGDGIPEMVETANGDHEWYLNGQLHRPDGPAIEYRGGGRQWWVHGRLHLPMGLR
jgi:hypothetical protein